MKIKKQINIKLCIVITVILFAVIPMTAAAQQIMASPMEGSWVWDGRGPIEAQFKELVFFGNIMLGRYDDYEYEGYEFDYYRDMIFFYDFYDTIWEFQIFDNTLLITDEWNNRYMFNRTNKQRSPVEGIWMQTGGPGYDPHWDFFFIFTGDVFAIGDIYGFDAYKVIYNQGRFSPLLEHLLLYYNISEANIAYREMTMQYILSGQGLIIRDIDNEEYMFARIY